MTAPIVIGDNVWLSTRSVFLKSATIPYGAIIGANVVVNKKFEKENSLIAGNPAVVKKSDITRVSSNQKRHYFQ